MEIEPPVWHDIAPDKFPCKCEYCGKQGKTGDFVYIDRRNKLSPIIVHKKCLGDEWLSRSDHAAAPKARTVAKIWHARGWPTKLKPIRKPKIDFSIPKELKKHKKR